MGGHFPDDGQLVLEQSLQVRIATMAFGGMSKSAMSKELGISAAKVSRIIQDEETIRYVRKLRDECVEIAKARIKKGAAELADRVVEVIKHHLDNNNLNAVPHALKVLDFGIEESSGDAGTNITVIMPDTGPKPRIVKEDGTDV